MTIREFAAPLGGLHPHAGGWCCTCPACGGRRQLLLGREVHGGILVSCANGCSSRAILDARARLLEEHGVSAERPSERLDAGASLERARRTGRAGARARWGGAPAHELERR